MCAGDYDNDGRTDLFTTAYGTNALYRNQGGGRFDDVTASAGFQTSGVRWGSGCTFLDYDRDGRLDLFVSNYLRLDLATAAEPGQGVNCLWKGIPVNCGPKRPPDRYEFALPPGRRWDIQRRVRRIGDRGGHEALLR